MPLRLAHVAEFFPFIFKSSFSGKETGIDIDMWSTAAKSKDLQFVRGTDYGGYTVDPETGQFSGLLGLLQNASVDGIAEDFTYRSSRMEHFYATAPIDWTVENFYERADPTSLGSIESFVVFPPLLLYLFVTSALLVIVVERVLFILRHRFRTKYILRTSPPLILVNSVLDQPVPEFRRKRSRWVADTGSCIDTSDYSFPPTSAIAQDAFGKLTPVTFYFGKHLGRKFKCWFDQVILRMLNEDKVVDFWWRRYTNRPRRETTVVPLYTYSPVPMRAFRDTLIVCGSLMAFAVVILLLEIVHKRFNFHNRAMRKITSILPEFP